MEREFETVEYIPPRALVEQLRKRITQANQPFPLGQPEPESPEQRSHNECCQYTPSRPLNQDNGCKLAGNSYDYIIEGWPLAAPHTSNGEEVPYSLTPLHTAAVNDSLTSKIGGTNDAPAYQDPSDLREHLQTDSHITPGSARQHQDSLNIQPVAVFNNNNSSLIGNYHYLHDNNLATKASPGYLIQGASKSALATGNNSSNVRNDYITKPELNTQTYPSQRAVQKGGVINNSTQVQRILTQQEIQDSKMSTYGNENYNTTGRMRVKPVGDDYFMLTVEDTGINPQTLRQQIHDQQVGPHYHTLDPSRALNQSQTGAVETVPSGTWHQPQQHMETVSSQPFMVTWSENGLPRINMMSTPWLSNTLPRPSASQSSSRSLGLASGQEMDDGGVEMPVYKIVDNQARHIQPTVSPLPANDSPPPIPPPRQRGFRTTQQNSRADSPPASWSQTLPSRPKARHPEYYGATLDSRPWREGVSTAVPVPMRINAPVPIDVRKVPPAGVRPSTHKYKPQHPLPQQQPQSQNSPLHSHSPQHYPHHSQNRNLSSQQYPNLSHQRDSEQNGYPADDPKHITVYNETLVVPPRKPAVKSASESHLPNQTYITVKRVDPESSNTPTFKISSSSPPISKICDKVSESTSAAAESRHVPRHGSPSGYLQTYLREKRSPSPARKISHRERGRTSSRPSRSRSKERKSRSPSPMPERCREIVFNDDIDWSAPPSKPGTKVDWDQIIDVMRYVCFML